MTPASTEHEECPCKFNVLKENDTDGRMAILMATGYAQGPLCQMITEYGVNSHAHDGPTYDKRDETH